MTLHRLNSVTIGVPGMETTAEYYADFGLNRLSSTDDDSIAFTTTDGGEQLRLVPSARRRLVQLSVGADDEDDIARIASSLSRLQIAAQQCGSSLCAYEAGTATSVVVEVAPRVSMSETPAEPFNSPGYVGRPNVRAPAILRSGDVRARKLGHVLLGSTDQARSERFFVEGLGFKVSDSVPGLAAFLRCSDDHHNVLVQKAPVAFLHHTSWQVDDVDEIGRGATAMLAKDPTRHVWGLGRHCVGSNFFWYLRDPAGNFSEYYSDLDCIVDDELWTPRVWNGTEGLYSWGPPPPPSFLAPDDLAELMTRA